MRFETKIITVERQMKEIDNVIDDQLMVRRFLAEPADEPMRRDIDESIMCLAAAKCSLRRLIASGATRTAISVPVRSAEPLNLTEATKSNAVL